MQRAIRQSASKRSITQLNAKPQKCPIKFRWSRPNRPPFEKGIYALPLTSGACRSLGIRSCVRPAMLFIKERKFYW
jgi:hypothetical protein